MEILDRKSTDIASLFADLDELLNTIEQTLKNRTPHLNGENFLSNRDVCRITFRLVPYKIGGIMGESRLFRLKGKFCISSLKS